ncbi:MAG: 16S rRNA (guanine(527)-N(7))-methyltransferase RsmG [Nitrospirota bacterium]|nr:16S rRNA (guanine(527)-N(7))-methyltransferase RsmG [Nitrospirota bacterium]
MTLRRKLTDGAKTFGLDLTDEQVDQFLFYLVELEKWNRKISLTSIKGEQDIVIKHFLDSFSYLKGFEPSAGTRLLDMGSGPGFPALPLKIAIPGLAVTMVESVQKKAAFLRHMVRMLRLQNAEVADKRTDGLPASYVEQYDVVTARAFSDMPSALHEGRRFLKPGGLMVLSRGPEETIADDIVDSFGMIRESRTELVLPFSDYRRTIWVFRKKS